LFNTEEKRGVFSIAGIYGLRMMGLFLILPVFAMYAESLRDVTPMLVGLALGAYGLLYTYASADEEEGVSLGRRRRIEI